jgi:FAD/FMN-containing dehydrogenase
LFVIVTEFKFRLIKAPSLVTTFSAIWDKNSTKLVMKQYQSIVFHDKTLNSNRNIFLSMLVNNTHVTISMFNFGHKLKDLNKTISLFLKNLPSPVQIDIHIKDWLTFVYELAWIRNLTGDPRQLLLENSPYPTYHYKAKHLYFNQPISDDSLDQLINRLSSGGGQVGMLFGPWDGYMSTVPLDKTAFPHRSYKFGIQFGVLWEEEQKGIKQMKYLEEVYSTIYEDSTKHSYINYIDRDVPDWMNVYYGTNLQRLRSIKQIYDKNNRFYFEKTIE